MPAREADSESARSLVHDALGRIMLSQPFKTSRQCQDLLTYIVDHSLAGEEASLRERIIGVEVFGRKPDYDTAGDPVVRIRASEIRKRLAVYYQTPLAQLEPVRIEIPSGSYVATFEWRDEPKALAAAHDPGATVGEDLNTHPLAEVSGPATKVLAPRAFQWHKWLLGALGFVILLVAVLRLVVYSSNSSALAKFWAPVVNNSNMAIVYLGSNAVYELSPSYMDAYRTQHPGTQQEGSGLQFYVPLTPGSTIKAEDLTASKNIFVTVGDVAATTRIVSFLVRGHKQFDVRYANDVAFGDLRQDPAVLIGAYNNLWTLALTGDLRFVFQGRLSIQNRSDPKKHWSAGRDSTDDYAIVSRIINSKTGRPVITAAGINQTGTRAAAEFITDPKAMEQLAKSLPKGWEQRNLQLVLHTNVMNQIPSAADVIDTYSW